MNKTGYIATVLIAFLLGGAGMWTWQHYRLAPVSDHTGIAMNSSPTTALGNLQAPGAGSNPASPNTPQAFQDPFKAMQQMQQQMDRFFNQDDFFGHSGITGNFGSWFNTPQGGFGTKIQKSEDKNSVSYKLKVGNNNLSNVHVNVQDGYVSIDAKLTDKSNNSIAQSSVSESFPVPAGVDPNSAKINKQGDAIVIRFDKIS